MKRRSPLALVVVAALALLAAACGVSDEARGWAAPVRTGDMLLVSTGKGRLDALDASTQAPLWRFPNRWSISEGGARSLKGIYGPPVLSDDGSTIFVGDYNGYLYAFRPGDLAAGGTDDKPHAAAVKLDGAVIGGLTLSNGILYVPSGRSLFRLDVADVIANINNKDDKVTVTRLFETEGEIWSMPTLQNGKVIFASLDGNLYAIDASTGQEVWRFTGTRSLASTPVIAGDLVLVGGFDTKLHAVDINTGEQRWEFEAENWVWSSPVIEDDRLYFGDFDGNVYAVSLSDGSEVWSSNLTDSPIVGSPALAGGVLVVAGQDGTIFGLDPATQAERWSPQSLGTSIAADLVAESTTVYLAPTGCVAQGEGSSRAYYLSVDALTGALRSTSEVC